VRIQRRFASLVPAAAATSFVVELQAGHVSLERVGIFTRAIRSLATSR
jgi:hypothetical protein